jgi:hypothetical protein
MADAPWSAEQIVQAMRNKGYVVFEGANLDLNIVGVRTSDPTVDAFNDFLYVIWREGGAWESRDYPITTDPGLYWLNNFEQLQVVGTAVLKAGQYRSAFTFGLHHNSYRALVQSKALPVYRDSNRDSVLDFDESTLDEGMFGIHIHKAGSRAEGSTLVNKWSAGCQVFSKESDFNEFMDLCDQSAQNHGDVFSYTLLNETDIS